MSEPAREMISRIHHVQITVPMDAEAAAIEFYCGVLGLRRIDKPLALQEVAGFWLAVGDQQLHVRMENGVDRNATKAHIAYEVANVRQWRQTLIRHGIATLDSIPLPGYDRFEFRDPFGNRVELIQTAAVQDER